MTHARDYTVQGNRFEKFCADHVPCPRCGGKLFLLPPSYPSADLECTDCDTWVNAKFNRQCTHRSHPQSRKALQSFIRRHGKRALFFVIGTEENHRICQLGRHGVKEFRTDRIRKGGQLQERVYFTFA